MVSGEAAVRTGHGADTILDVTRVPLLSLLPRVQQAKLVPDLTLKRLPPGEVLAGTAPAAVLILVRGQVEVLGPEGQSLFLAGAGELIGEWGLMEGWDHPWSVRALADADLVALPLERFEQIVAESPEIAAHFRNTLLLRTVGAMEELARARQLASAYVTELWQDVPAPADSTLGAVSATRLPAPPVLAQPAPDAQAGPWRPRWTTVAALLGTMAGLGLGLMPGPTGHFNPFYAALGLLAAAVVNWVVGAVPDWAVALALVSGATVAGLAPPAKSLSGFASPQWFLLLSIWGISAAVTRSGLLYRLALYMLRILPPSYLGQSLGLMLTGIIVTPLLPNVQSRLVMVAPLAKELGEALRLRRGSKGMAGLALACVTGFGLLYFQFLNGSTLPLLAWSLLPAAWQQQVTWVFWVLAALPMGVLVGGGCFLLVWLWYRPPRGARVPRQIVQMQLRVLGPLSRTELITAVVLGATLLSFVFAGQIGLDPAWAAMAGMLTLVAVSILTKDTLRRSVDWGFLLFFGAVMSFSALIQGLGVGDRLEEMLVSHISLAHASPYTFVAAVAVVTFGVRLVVPAIQATPILILVFTPLAGALGISPLVSSLAVLAMGTNFVVPQQNPFYMALHAGMEEGFNHRAALPFALAHAGLVLLGLLISVPVWQGLGLLR